MDNSVANKVDKDDDAVLFPDQIPEIIENKNNRPKNEEETQRERDRSNDIVPLWYDPIFTQVFNDLRNKYVEL